MSASKSEPPLIRQGWLVKQGGFFKNLQRRWFELRGNMAYYYVDETKSVKRGDFSLLHTQIAPTTALGKSFCIQVTPETKSRVFYLIAENNEDMEEWINALMRASVWEPGIESLQVIGREETMLNAKVSGMMNQEMCHDHVRDILKNLSALESGLTRYDLDTKNGTIHLEGNFNSRGVIIALEEAGYLVYPI